MERAQKALPHYNEEVLATVVAALCVAERNTHEHGASTMGQSISQDGMFIAKADAAFAKVELYQRINTIFF